MSSDVLKLKVVNDLVSYSTELTQTELMKKNPKTEPVIIERPYTATIVGSSLPIIRMYGDWGQGKSTIGASLYHFSRKSKTIYVTYIALSKLHAELGNEAEISGSTMKKFYTNVLGSDKQPFPGISNPYSRRFAMLLTPLICSPKTVGEIYGTQGGALLTTLPRDKECDVEVYTRSPYEALINVGDKLDKRYFVIIDELEGIPEINKFSGQMYGDLLLDVRRAYDKYNINKITLVFSVQQTERVTFDRMLEEIKSIPKSSRVYGVLSQPIEISKLSKEELIKYAKELVRVVVGESTFLEDALEVIAELAYRAENTRIATSLVREFLWLSLVHSLERNEFDFSKISNISNKELLIYEIKKFIKNKKLIVRREDVNRAFGFPKIIEEIYIKNFTNINKYAQTLVELTVKYIWEELKARYPEFQLSNPSLRSRNPGYVSYQILIRPKSRGKIERFLRLILWVRFSRIYTQRLSRETLLQKLGFSKHNLNEELKKFDTKIVCLHPTIIRGAVLQEIDPNIFLPIQISEDDIASMATIAGLAPELNEEIANSLRNHFERNLIPKIVNTILEEVVER